MKPLGPIPAGYSARDGELAIAGRGASEWVAEAGGTPLFVYSEATLLHHLSRLQEAFAPADPLIAYSVKTNGNLSICRLMAENSSVPRARRWARPVVLGLISRW